MPKLDKKNRQILYELDSNARIPITALAKKVALSKDAITNRIRGLRESGILRGFYTVIDYSLIGYYGYRLLLKFTTQSKEVRKKVISTTKKIPSVNFLVSLADQYDMAINFNEQNPQDFFEKYQRLLFTFQKNILEKQTNIIHSIIHTDLPPLRTGQEKLLYTTGMQRKTNTLSEAEVSLLSILGNNARISLVDLGAKLNIPSTTVKYRMQQLEKRGIIKGYRVHLDWSRLDYTHYKLFISLNSLTKQKYNEVKEALLALPDRIYITEVLAPQDLECELLCASYAKLLQNISLITKDFGREIKKITTLVTLDVNQINYLPQI